MTLPLLAIGGRGVISVVGNIVPGDMKALIAAFEAGDMPRARAAQLAIVRLVDVLARHGYLRASKAVMAIKGIDSGTVRLPLQPVGAADVAAIRADLEAAGFADVAAAARAAHT
jgi:4-hydroxy-tetrahydrodipicolinate synthase